MPPGSGPLVLLCVCLPAVARCSCCRSPTPGFVSPLSRVIAPICSACRFTRFFVPLPHHIPTVSSRVSTLVQAHSLAHTIHVILFKHLILASTRDNHCSGNKPSSHTPVSAASKVRVAIANQPPDSIPSLVPHPSVRTLGLETYYQHHPSRGNLV